MRGEDEENKDEGEGENDHWRDALGRLLFLERHAKVVEAHFFRHGLGEYFLHGRHGLAGAVAVGRGRVDLGRAIHVKAHGEFRSVPGFTLHDAGDRNTLAVAVAHVKLPDLFDVRAVSSIGLHVNLPLEAEPVEIIDHRSTEESAQRIVGIIDAHTFDQRLVAIDRKLELGDGGQECGIQVLQFGTFGGGGHEDLRLLGQERDSPSRTVLQDEIHAA